MKKQTLLLFYMDSIYWTKFGKTWEDRFAGKVGGGGGDPLYGLFYISMTASR